MTTAHIQSPVGELTLVASDRGLVAVLWPDEPSGRVVLASDGEPTTASERIVRQAEVELGEYFAGERRQFAVPLDPRGTPFQRAAWEVLRTIPYGSTMTYGQQARQLGDPRKARAVGAANGRNPISIIVPCHRVVGADGSLTGFAGGLSSKEWLLSFEHSH